MITVAVAGGTSPGLGRSILEALKGHEDSIKAIVLSRESSKTPQWLKNLNVEIRKVDHKSNESLDSALTGVNTVICTLLAKDGSWVSTQKNLLNACLRTGVSRFAPAEFGCGPLAAKNVSMLAPQIEVMDACRDAKQNDSNFEYAGFHLGLFMNYLGYGAPDEEEALHGFDDNWRDVWFHVKEMKAEVPLTSRGEVPRITMTEIRDVGRFVATACLLPKDSWQEDFSMAGETLPMDETIKIIEKVRDAKVDVVYRAFEQVANDSRQEKDFYRKFWYELEEMVARDAVGEGVVEPALNTLCPSIIPMSIEEYLRKYWA